MSFDLVFLLKSCLKCSRNNFLLARDPLSKIVSNKNSLWILFAVKGFLLWIWTLSRNWSYWSNSFLSFQIIIWIYYALNNINLRRTDRLTLVTISNIAGLNLGNQSNSSIQTFLNSSSSVCLSSSFIKLYTLDNNSSKFLTKKDQIFVRGESIVEIFVSFFNFF